MKSQVGYKYSFPNDSACIFEMPFAPSKRKILLQDRNGSKLNVLIEEQLDEADRSLLRCCISPGGCISENCLRAYETRLAFTNLRHLWRRHDIRLSTKSSV